MVVVWFARTQSFSVQHYYLLQPGILIICSLFVLKMMARWSSAWSHGVALGLMVATAGLIGLSMFVPRAAALHTGLRPLVPRDAYYPLVRHDVAELNCLYATISELLNQAGDTATKFYVLSATSELNDTHFISTSIKPPFGFASGDRLLRMHHIDKRDGFPRRLLEADIVVLGSPLGGKGNFSQVLLEPARLIESSVGLGRAFVELPYEFHLDNEVTAKLFKKVRPFTAAEIQALSDHLRRLYPDYPHVYEPSYGER